MHMADALLTPAVAGTMYACSAAAAVIGGLISLLASAYPDGLEWSMERVAGTAELQAEGAE